MEKRRTLTYYLKHQHDVLPHVFSLEIQKLKNLVKSKGIVLLSIKELSDKLLIENQHIDKEFYFDLIKLLAYYELTPIPFFIPYPLTLDTQIYIALKPNLYNDKDCVFIKNLQEKHSIAKRDLPKLKLALQKVQNYNILLRVFEALSAVTKEKLNVYIRCCFDNIINEFNLPAEGAIFIRQCFTYVAEVTTAGCDFADKKYCLTPLKEEQLNEVTHILAILAASLPYFAEIDEAYPFANKVKQEYLKLKPNAFELKSKDEFLRPSESVISARKKNKAFNFSKIYSDKDKVLERKKAISQKDNGIDFVKSASITDFYTLNLQQLPNKDLDKKCEIKTYEHFGQGSTLSINNIDKFIKNSFASFIKSIPNPEALQAYYLKANDMYIALSTDSSDSKTYEALFFKSDDEKYLNELAARLCLNSNSGQNLELFNYVLSFSAYYLMLIKPLIEGYDKTSYQALNENFVKNFDLTLDCNHAVYSQSLALSYILFRFDLNKEDVINEDFVKSFIYCPQLLTVLQHKILSLYNNDFSQIPYNLQDLFCAYEGLKFLNKHLNLFKDSDEVAVLKFIIAYLRFALNEGKEFRSTSTINLIATSVSDSDFALKNTIEKEILYTSSSLAPSAKIILKLIFDEINDGYKLVFGVKSQSIQRYLNRYANLFSALFSSDLPIYSYLRKVLIKEAKHQDINIICDFFNREKTPKQALEKLLGEKALNEKQLDSLTNDILQKGQFIIFPLIVNYAKPNHYVFANPFNPNTSSLTILKRRHRPVTAEFLQHIKTLQAIFHLHACVNINFNSHDDINELVALSNFQSIVDKHIAKVYLKTFKNYLKIYDPRPQVDLRLLKNSYLVESSIFRDPTFRRIFTSYSQNKILTYRFAPLFTQKLQLILDSLKINTKTLLHQLPENKPNFSFSKLNQDIINSKLEESAQVQDVIEHIKAENQSEDQAAIEDNPPALQEDTKPNVTDEKSDNLNVEKPQIDKNILALIKAVEVQKRDIMDLREFTGLCLSSGFMSLDAAVEIINDFTYDNFDEPLFDLAPEEGCVYITEDLIAKLAIYS